jgi:hypothetical protein
MSVPYKLWHVQREDLYHARHVAQARASVFSHHGNAAKFAVDQKKIMSQRMMAEALDKDNCLLLKRLQKIHSRSNTGWNKSHLFERLSPQFKRQLAQVRYDQMAELKNKNWHDQRRLREVTAHVKHGHNESSIKTPQRPSGLNKSRQIKSSARRQLQKVRTNNGPETTTTEPNSPIIQPKQQKVDATTWKLCYRAGTRLDMLDPYDDQKRLKNKSKLCIVSLWQLHSSSSDFRLLVLCEDVKTMLKKSILLRSHHIKYMMTLKEDNGDKIRKRRLDSRGWDHAVQIPVNARESFDEYHLHNNLNVTKIGPLRPPQSTTSTTYSKMWYSIILNSLVISTDLALIVQHPLKEKLSKKKLNENYLMQLIKYKENEGFLSSKAIKVAKEAEEAALLTTKKNPRDMIDDNCTFSPKLIAKPLRKRRNIYEKRAVHALERSRLIVLETGHEYTHLATTSEKLQKEQERRKSLRVMNQLQEEALLKPSKYISAYNLRNTTKTDTTKTYTTKTDTTKKDSAKMDIKTNATKAGTTKTDITKRDSKKRDSTKRDTAKHNSAKRDTAKRDATKRDAAGTKSNTTKLSTTKPDITKRNALKPDATKRDVSKRGTEKRGTEKRGTKKRTPRSRKVGSKDSRRKVEGNNNNRRAHGRSNDRSNDDKVMKKVSDLDELHDGASKIQAVYRRRQAKQKVKDMKEQEKSATKMQAIARGRANRRRKKERDNAAAKLQSRFRGKRARIRVQDLAEERYEEWRRSDALENLFRYQDRDMDGYLSENDLARMLREIPRRKSTTGFLFDFF